MKITLQVNGREMTFSEVELIALLEEHFSKQAMDTEIKWGDHTKPTLYPGYTKIEGTTWKKGPQALDAHGYPMVWIPAALVMPNGLSRINYDNSEFSDDEYHEEIPEWRVQQIYADGGFWSPANPVSRGKNGKLQLIEGKEVKPLNDISYNQAVVELQELDTPEVGYRPIYGVEIDCLCKWLELNGYSMIDSTIWGNYYNTPNREYGLAPIGSRKEARTKIGINDFGGTRWWITEEKHGRSCCCVVRGGSFDDNGDGYPAGKRDFVSACSCNDWAGVWAAPFKK